MTLFPTIVVGACIVVGLISLLRAWRTISTYRNRIGQIRDQAKKIAAGDFSGRSSISHQNKNELRELVEALNDVSNQLGKKLNETDVQRHEQNAVLASLREAVVAVDHDARIKYVNDEAALVFGIPADEISRVSGQTVEETIRVPQLQKLISDSLKDETLEREVELVSGLSESGRTFQVRASPLTVQGEVLGSVIVLNDVTKLKTLENHRRDFVANVSHELRTPLTSIQGYAETLRASDQMDPEQRNEFIDIIYRHSARLGSIVEDLLMLSKIEKDTDASELEMDAMLIRPLLESIVALSADKAKKSNVELKVRCEADLRVPVDATLLERAISNLINNAIKYIDKPAGRIEVFAEEIENGKVRISVTDNGMGIATEHLPRIFERFYRVDKARSRQLGGTGLGLSIVKHVALAHGGEVGVRSELNKGSSFFIDLKSTS